MKRYRLVGILLIILFTFGIALGAITLTITPPTTNTDGSTLTDLAGFRIYYGLSSGTYPNQVDIGNTTSYTFSSLPSGTYHFVATAYNSENPVGESAYSNELVKVAINYFTASSTAGAHGTITPQSITIAYGSQATFTVTPANGYTVAMGGTCGGILTGSTYVTYPLSSNCTVTATFATTLTYTVTPSAGAHGTISPATGQTVSSGQVQLFTVTPSTNYITYVGGTCGGSLNGTTYTTYPIIANCTVAASFVQYQTNQGHVGAWHGGRHRR